MRMLVERSVVLSPLLNLAPAAPTGATLKHVRPLVQLGDSRISGTATLLLSPDRRTVTVSVQLDRPRAAIIRLRRLRRLQAAERGPAEESSLIVEVIARGWPKQGACTGRRFSLDREHPWGIFAETGELLKSGISVSELGAGSVEGIHVEPAGAGRRGSLGPTNYLTARIRAEIAAAECSLTAAATARHVELATLYARRLRDGEARLR